MWWENTVTVIYVVYFKNIFFFFRDKKSPELRFDDWLDGILKTVVNSITQAEDKESKGRSLKFQDIRYSFRCLLKSLKFLDVSHSFRYILKFLEISHSFRYFLKSLKTLHMSYRYFLKFYFAQVIVQKKKNSCSEKIVLHIQNFQWIKNK